MSGEFVVEDVSVNGEIFRRLVFFNNPKLIQSESRILTGYLLNGITSFWERKKLNRNALNFEEGYTPTPEIFTNIVVESYKEKT